jgi:hypothetical protein
VGPAQPCCQETEASRRPFFSLRYGPSRQQFLPRHYSLPPSMAAMKPPPFLSPSPVPSLYKSGRADPSLTSSLALSSRASLSQCSSPEFTAVRRRSSTMPSQSAPPSVETHRSSLFLAGAHAHHPRSPPELRRPRSTSSEPRPTSRTPARTCSNTIARRRASPETFPNPVQPFAWTRARARSSSSVHPRLKTTH